MIHVYKKFHEILFIRLEVVAQTRKKGIFYLTSLSDLDLGVRNLSVVCNTLSSDEACVYEVS